MAKIYGEVKGICFFCDGIFPVVTRDEEISDFMETENYSLSEHGNGERCKGSNKEPDLIVINFPKAQ